jgi:hypothetical protein
MFSFRVPLGHSSYEQQEIDLFYLKQESTEDRYCCLLGYEAVLSGIALEKYTKFNVHIACKPTRRDGIF